MQMLLFTALLCSSDVVAAVSIVDYNAQPKLYSCIFGEGCFNDIVSIILFNTVSQLQGKAFTSTTPFEIAGQFILLGLVSISVGLIFGFVTCLMFKHMRFLSASVVTETFIIFAMSLVSYFVSELTVIGGLQMSGIISLLMCGIIQAHYTWYNLSPQGKSTTSVTFSFLGMSCEAAVYSYIGIALYSTIPEWWSFSWAFVQLTIIILGRIVGVLGTFYLFRCCFRKKTIAFKELLFITYAGMIRGAIAFALVLKIPYVGSSECEDPDECYSVEAYELAVSTTLLLVMATTLIFGTFMKLTQNFLIQEKKPQV